MSIPSKIVSRFPQLPDAEMRRLLEPPTGSVRMILDTDTANEIDDQFALAWALLSPDQIKIEGVTVEPFSFQHHRSGLLRAQDVINAGSPTNEEEAGLVGQYKGWLDGLKHLGKEPADVPFVTPKEGEALSYQEVLRVYDKLHLDPGNMIFHGSPDYLTSLDEPHHTPAAKQIIERALVKSDDPLYISAIGCVTNVASALLIEPEIIKNMVVVWTSGFPSGSHRSNDASLNLVQDRLASQLLFACGVPLVYLPGFHIGAQLTLSLPDMQRWVKGRGAIGDYLYHLYTHNPIHEQRGITDIDWRTWVIWDVINIAWLLNPDWVPSDLLHAPQLSDKLTWQHSENSHLMREAYGINRDAIFHDFFQKLDKASS
ncbi:nucleoside hydrolase [Chloroflexi bacterium TSY]|nr:nucleoside hydrolase [Chloroflexi bacterium TSY]